MFYFLFQVVSAYDDPQGFTCRYISQSMNPKKNCKNVRVPIHEILRLGIVGVARMLYFCL